MKRSGRKSAAQTPAPKKERVYGSKKNPSGSAASKRSAASITLSESITETLKNKKEEFEKKYPSKSVGLATLKAVMRRGMGAYSKSHRPTISGGAPNSRQAWGFARVNKFLLKKAGKKVKAAYVQDDDLLENGGEIKLLAPNGEKSNLTLEQYRLVRTPEFKEWFGDWENDPQNASKVVDENGEPLVVYHGTSSKFNKFSKLYSRGKRKQEGIYFSDNIQVAKLYGDIILNCFLSIKKPFIKDYNGQNYWELFGASDLEISAQYNRAKKNITQNDGVILLNIKDSLERFTESELGNNYIAFYPNQIKLADGTNTTFDGNNPDIRFKDGGMTKIQLPDNESSYENLQPILAKQGYKLEKIMKPTKSVQEIADEHDVSVDYIENQIKIGTEHEKEHYYSSKLARNTAIHHIQEYPDYYERLKELENKALREQRKSYEDGGYMKETCEILDNEGERKIDKESIETLTKCIEGLPQTKVMHFDLEKNEYFPYRKRLHKDIIYHFKKDLVCVERDEPIAILMGGSPASGKSTFLKKYAPYLLKEEIFKVDADEIRSKLPEYKGYNASQTHLETKDIVNTLLSDRNIGIPCRFDVIYDGTMNNTKSYLPLISILKREGYKVFIVYIDKVPKDVVVERSLKRYQKSGRFVPLEVIDDFFEKGKSALELLKEEVDGYMIVDGSDTNYKIIERGGEELPQDRNYSKIGAPIKITSEEVVRELKRGGKINPDDPKYKEEMTHKSGSAGGLLVGNRHSEGGIKAVNKSTGQALEMEGGEVVITRDAVSDNTKRQFEGKMLTNREILSRINESGGGVSFAEGGDIPERCKCSGKEYNFGGKIMKDDSIVQYINTNTKKLFGIKYPELKPSEAMKKLFTPKYKYESGGLLNSESGMLYLIDKRIPSLSKFKSMFPTINGLMEKKYFKDYLFENFSFDFEQLPHQIQAGILLGNQKLIDEYLDK